MDRYAENIEIVVSDNSDPDVAASNRATLDGRIRYSRNESNLGYAGNIKRCLALASGEFLWILSDDDTIEWQGFVEVVSRLDSRKAADVLILKTRTTTVDGRKVIVPDRWILDPDSRMTMGEVLSKGFIPFLFIGGYVVRRTGWTCRLSEVENSDNDYFHALAYLASLDSGSTVDITSGVVVEYLSAPEVRFSVFSISVSIREMIACISRWYGVRMSYRRVYPEHLKWLVYSRVGLIRILKSADDRSRMARLFFRYPSLLALAYCSLLYVTPGVLRFIYRLYSGLIHPGARR